MSQQPSPQMQKSETPAADAPVRSRDPHHRTHVTSIAWTVAGLVIFCSIFAGALAFLSFLTRITVAPRIDAPAIAILLLLALLIPWEAWARKLVERARDVAPRKVAGLTRKRIEALDAWLDAGLPQQRSVHSVLSEVLWWLLVICLVTVGYWLILESTLPDDPDDFGLLAYVVYWVCLAILAGVISIPVVILVRRTFYLFFGRIHTAVATQVRYFAASDLKIAARAGLLTVPAVFIDGCAASAWASNLQPDKNLLLLGLLVGMILLAVMLRFWQGGSRLSFLPEQMTSDASILIQVHEINYNPTSLAASVSIQNVSDEERRQLAAIGNIQLNGQNVPIRFSGTNSASHQEGVIIFTSDGTPYLYPFSQYTISINLGQPARPPFDGMQVIVRSTSGTYTLFPDPTTSNHVRFRITYTAEPKLIAIMVAFALLVFIWAMLKVDYREELIELSIGAFAALIAIRSFLLPNELDTPTLVDRYILVYVLVLMVVFAARFHKLSQMPRQLA